MLSKIIYALPAFARLISFHFPKARSRNSSVRPIAVVFHPKFNRQTWFPPFPFYCL